MKFIEVHPAEFPDKRIYINPASIMAVGENERHEALIFYNTLRAPEHCVESYDNIQIKIIKALLEKDDDNGT